MLATSRIIDELIFIFFSGEVGYGIRNNLEELVDAVLDPLGTRFVVIFSGFKFVRNITEKTGRKDFMKFCRIII